MDFKLLGSILLIVGTSIGAGMLALPIATAQLGFLGSLILLFVCWFVMTAGAFLILEVNLRMPMNSNLNTMAKATIGPVGQVLSWGALLMLFYALLSAYIGGGSDLLQHLLAIMGVNVSFTAAAILFTLIFGSIVYLGIRTVDIVNRGLMLVKFIAYFILVIILTPFVSRMNLLGGDFHYLTSAAAITVTITSFGFAAIVPSLRVYFQGDVAKLKKAILIGSLIPLICYIAWDFAIMGVLPLNGEHGLIAIFHSNQSTSELVNAITLTASTSHVAVFARLFTSICVLTSFLGVALCLVDFWADGLQVEKKGVNRLLISLITFLPPLLIVLFVPGVFVKALEYAGINCMILLIIIPAWMAWSLRGQRQIGAGFIVPGGKPLLLGLILFSLIVMGKSLVGV